MSNRKGQMRKVVIAGAIGLSVLGLGAYGLVSAVVPSAGAATLTPTPPPGTPVPVGAPPTSGLVPIVSSGGRLQLNGDGSQRMVPVPDNPPPAGAFGDGTP